MGSPPLFVALDHPSYFSLPPWTPAVCFEFSPRFFIGPITPFLPTIRHGLRSTSPPGARALFCSLPSFRHPRAIRFAPIHCNEVGAVFPFVFSIGRFPLFLFWWPCATSLLVWALPRANFLEPSFKNQHGARPKLFPWDFSSTGFFFFFFFPEQIPTYRQPFFFSAVLDQTFFPTRSREARRGRWLFFPPLTYSEGFHFCLGGLSSPNLGWGSWRVLTTVLSPLPINTRPLLPAFFSPFFSCRTSGALSGRLSISEPPSRNTGFRLSLFLETSLYRITFWTIE